MVTKLVYLYLGYKPTTILLNSFLHSHPEKETVCTQGADTLVLPVRTHGSLMRFSWAKLWYYARAIDEPGRGIVVLSWATAKRHLGCASSTLYQWLREAKEAGAIYEFKRQGDRLKIRLGGLFNVCRTLGLSNWGAVAVLPLGEVLTKCRALATAIATQQLQEQSRYAAHKSLSNSDKKVFTIPKALDVIGKGQNASHEPIRGATKIPFLIHVGAKRAFVSKGFIPFGTSQGAVASELGISDRTVRRHLSKLDVTSRQICQSKQEYAMVAPAIRYGAGEYVSESDVRFRIDENEIILHERNGWTSHSKKGGHRIPISDNGLSRRCDRFFTYFGKTWLYRCSLYGLSLHLKKMKVARRNYRRSLANDKDNLSSNPSVARAVEHKNL